MEPIWQVRFNGEFLGVITDTQRRNGWIDLFFEHHEIQIKTDDHVEYRLHNPLPNPNDV